MRSQGQGFTSEKGKHFDIIVVVGGRQIKFDVTRFFGEGF